MKTLVKVTLITVGLLIQSTLSYQAMASITGAVDCSENFEFAKLEVKASTFEMNEIVIPLEVVFDHFILIDVSINGEQLKFLYDENALFTTIDNAKAMELGVMDQKSILIGGYPVEGSIRFADMSSVRNSGLEVFGIIGAAIVDYFDVKVDIAGKVIVCTPIGYLQSATVKIKV